MMIPTILYTFSYAALSASIITTLAFFIIAYRYHCHTQSIQRLASHHYKVLLHHYSAVRQTIKVGLIVSALCALLLAFLRPSWGSKETVVEVKGRDVVIALDISRSMLAQDIAPSRLKAAQQKIQQLVDSLTSDRVSLLIFSGTALTQCPLTHDYAAFSLFLQEIDEHTLSTGTTDLATAIAEALAMFKRQPPKKDRLLIIVTDGEDFSENLATLEQEARELNVQIFILGIGTPQGAPIPLFDQQGKPLGHQKDAKGDIVITKLNEPLLAQVAQTIGGHYVLMTTNDNDIATIKKWLEHYEDALLHDRRHELKEERYYYFTGTALFLLLLEWLL